MSEFKRRKTTEQRDLVSEYSTLLEAGGGGRWSRESSLPAPKDEIKKALLAEAVVNVADPAYLDALRNCYVSLCNFVADDIAEEVQRLGLRCLEQAVKTHIDPHQLQEHELDELASDLGEIDTDRIKRQGEERRRLPAEFDEIVDGVRRLFAT